LRFTAGGLAFSAEPDAKLLASERAALARLDPAGETREPFRIELVDEPPWTSDDASLFPQWEPAVQRFEAGLLLASHRSFVAEIDPFAARARLFRRESRPYPLEAVIRTSMMARLPLQGGLALHAAGVLLGGRGVAFFGPSGAGKSTLASTAVGPVLSDELVAVAPSRPFTLVRSGFWGAAGSGLSGAGAPLALLVELAKGPSFTAERLAPAVAAGRLLASVPTPNALPFWQAALAVAAEVVTSVPVLRMEWTPARPPWTDLETLLEFRFPGSPARGAAGPSASSRR
jgi:hypothetical protein